VTWRIPALGASCVAAAVALSGCGDDRAMPVPAGTPTPTPDTAQTEPPEQIDPRCLASYPDDAVLIYEGVIEVRPFGFPSAPDFAVLCWVQIESPVEQIGYYAMTNYTSFDKVLWYYEHAFPGGQHGRAATADGEILTGVFGESSYFINTDGTNRYYIDWAIDGQYDYDE